MACWKDRSGTPRPLSEIVRLLLEHKEELQEKYGIVHLKIFGSYARNEQREKSDLDLIVSLNGKIDLLSFVELKHVLEEITGLPVDLVTDKGLSPFIRPYVEACEVF